MKQPLIRIDAERHDVFVGDKNVYLSPKEWELLHALIPGKVMSREQLMLEVWGRTVTIDERSVDQHVARLRRKFPRLNVVETIPCYGYRIVLGAVAA